MEKAAQLYSDINALSKEYISAERIYEKLTETQSMQRRELILDSAAQELNEAGRTRLCMILSENDEFLYIDIDSVDNKNNVIVSPKRLRTENAPSRASRFTQKGDVVFSMVRPYLKNIAVVPENNCIASTGFYVCSPNESLCSDYLYFMMLSPYVVDGLDKFMKGDNSPSINTNNILQWKYPIPPLKEQNRIVEEVRRLFSYLDKVESLLAM